MKTQRTLEFFSIERDLDMVQGWYAQRGIPGISDIDALPRIGMVADGIAAGWLWQTDSKTCFLGNFIADPASSEEDRDAAIELLIEGLRRQAEGLEYRTATAFTRLPAIIKRVAKWGMVAEGGFSQLTGPISQVMADE